MTPPLQTVVAPATVIAPKKQEEAKVGDLNIAPTTTAAGDLVTAGQRKINLLWESTQAAVAILVTGITLFVAATLCIKGNSNEAFLLLSNAFFAVITAYLTRTNHSRTGGVQEDKRRGE